VAARESSRDGQAHDRLGIASMRVTSVRHRSSSVGRASVAGPWFVVGDRGVAVVPCRSV
jgi:hypothetical protein